MTAHEPPKDDAVFDSKREWAVYHCMHGCLHVLLDRVSLTLTEAEFYALQDLMRRASERFQQRGARQAVSSERMH
jgi:hypothetical protein